MACIPGEASHLPGEAAAPPCLCFREQVALWVLQAVHFQQRRAQRKALLLTTCCQTNSGTLCALAHAQGLYGATHATAKGIREQALVSAKQAGKLSVSDQTKLSQEEAETLTSPGGNQWSHLATHFEEKLSSIRRQDASWPAASSLAASRQLKRPLPDTRVRLIYIYIFQVQHE